MSLKFGMIYERNGLYWVKYHDRGVAYREGTGKRGKEGKTAAKALLRARQKEIQGGGFVPGADKLRMADLGKLLTGNYEANERKSLRRAKAAVAHLTDYFSTTPATRIAAKVPSYIAARREERTGPPPKPGKPDDRPRPAAATIAYEVACLRRCFTLAVRAGLLMSRPLIENVRVQNARQGFVDEKTFRKVVVALPDHLRLPIRFAFETAWRRSEWTDLKWTDVDLEAGEIRLAGAATKSGQPRTLPLAGAVKEIIEEQLARTKAWEKEHAELVPLVFWRPTGVGAKPLGDFRESWEKATKAAAVPWLLVHDLRRSRARLWSNNGTPDRVGMALGGWKTRSVYDRYGVVSKSDLTDALERTTKSRTHES